MGSGYLSAVTFPLSDTEEQYDAVRRDEVALRPGVDALLSSLGHTGDVQRFAGGSLPVYAVGDDLVLKLYPPVYAEETGLESGVLDAVHGRLPVATPRVEAVGEYDRWGYVLMERLPGAELKDVWPTLDLAARHDLAAQLGEVFAALHGLPVPHVEGLRFDDWDAFVKEQKAGAAEQQRARKLGEEWIEQIPAFLDSVTLPAGAPVLLHTESMPDHFLIGDDGRLSGLFDFEPALRGAWQYEFVAPAVFFTGEGVLARILSSYGKQLDARTIMAYTLLHEYSHLPWYMEVLPESKATTLDDLAHDWWD
ncbi:aminoglycoside 3'-phosphotransferase/choline kinase family protein [Nonomuraea africana]